MKRDRKEMKGYGKDMKRGTMLIAAVMAAMILCMGCSGEDRSADGTDSGLTAETVGTTVQSGEAAQQEATDRDEVSEAEEAGVAESAETETEATGQEAAETEEQEAGLGDSTESEVTEDADEWTALYNEYKEQGVLYFTIALCEAGYDQICLVNGNVDVTDYFSVKDGNHYTISEGVENVLLYVPYTPTEYSCDNENIKMHYWYVPDSNDEILESMINSIQLYCADFEGDDVPVNISVTFEDGSTQEITVYLTRHADAE